MIWWRKRLIHRSLYPPWLPSAPLLLRTLSGSYIRSALFPSPAPPLPRALPWCLPKIAGYLFRFRICVGCQAAISLLNTSPRPNRAFIGSQEAYRGTGLIKHLNLSKNIFKHWKFGFLSSLTLSQIVFGPERLFNHPTCKRPPPTNYVGAIPLNYATLDDHYANCPNWDPVYWWKCFMELSGLPKKGMFCN